MSMYMNREIRVGSELKLPLNALLLQHRNAAVCDVLTCGDAVIILEVTTFTFAPSMLAAINLGTLRFANWRKKRGKEVLLVVLLDCNAWLLQWRGITYQYIKIKNKKKNPCFLFLPNGEFFTCQTCFAILFQRSNLKAGILAIIGMDMAYNRKPHFNGLRDLPKTEGEDVVLSLS